MKTLYPKAAWVLAGAGLCVSSLANKCPPESKLVKRSGQGYTAQYCMRPVKQCPENFEMEMVQDPNTQMCLVAHGPVLYNYDSGATALVEYRNGLLHGGSRAWNPQKKKTSEDNYVNGKRHGKRKAWYSDGNPLYEENYRDGLKHGLAYEWYPNKALKSAFLYQAGKRSGISRTWYSTGTKRSEFNYTAGLWQGEQKEWYSNNKLFSTTQYQRGIPEGVWLYGYKSGAKRAEIHYVKGLMDGTYTAWKENGMQEFVIQYQAGKAVGVPYYEGNRDELLEQLKGNGMSCEDFRALRGRVLASAGGMGSYCIRGDFDGNGFTDYAFPGLAVLTNHLEVLKLIPIQEKQFEAYQATMVDGLFGEPTTPRAGLVQWGSASQPTKVMLYDYDTETFLTSQYAADASNSK